MRLGTLFPSGDRDREQRLAHALREVPVFRDVPADDLVALWRRLREEDVPAGTVLCRRGDPGDCLYIVRRGAVSIQLGTGPDALGIQLGPGHVVGEMALFTGQARSTDVVVAEDAALWVLERMDFEEAAGRSAPLLRAVIRVLCERIAFTNRLLDRVDDHTTDVGGVGALRFGPYRVMGQLGAGGMAVVYSAVHVDTEVAAAIKVLPAAWGSAPELQERLRAEAHVLQRVRHPNVIGTLEVGEVDARLGGGCYLAMEWLPNALDRALRAQYPEPFAPATALRIVHGVASGLAAVHERGLVHRDVKPSNILLRADGTPVLADFGLATAIRDSAYRRRLTPPNLILGTADYLPPEQVAGTSDDARSDLYSLGVVLYELLAGSVPFAGRTPEETLRAHAEEEPPALPERVPPGARRLVERALRKRPEDRFPSAAAMAEAAARALWEARTLDPGAEQRVYVRLLPKVHGHTGEPVVWTDPQLVIEWWDDLAERWAQLEAALVDAGRGGLGVLCPDPPVIGARIRAYRHATTNAHQGPNGGPVVAGHVVYEALVDVGVGILTYRCGLAFDQPQPQLSFLLTDHAFPGAGN